MRLDFNILWVEDNPGNVQSQRERIELLIEKEGFRLQAKFASSVDEATGYLSDDIYGDHIDLVLMDYDLGAGKKGNEGLAAVRNIFQYKDIIFYSSQAQDLQAIVAKDQVQGVFCSTREELTNTVDGLFETLVKKVLDIDHSRGIVMGATSDIDHCVIDCLTLSFDNGSNELRTSALKTISRHVKEKQKSYKKNLDKLAAVKHLSELESLHFVYSSLDKLRLLKSILKSAKLHTDRLDDISRYMNETLPRRNDLAHVRVRSEGFSRKLFNSSGDELTSEQMKSLRQTLLQDQNLFERLSEQLNGHSES